MHICIHRGSNQIGGSCVEIESSNHRLIIDLGLPLDADKNDIQYLHEISGLDGNDPSLLGILISHGHLDHFGLLAHISPKIPVAMGPASRRILTVATPFMNGKWLEPSLGWDYKSDQSFKVGPFKITPYLVDHSAYDAYALLIESEGKRIFYSGDFRSHGRKAVLFERLLSDPPTKIDTLLLEGSSLGRLSEDRHFASESEIEKQFIQIILATQGLALIHTSAQNIDRIVSIMRACIQTGRKLVIDLYTAVILEATGNKNIPQSKWSDVALFIPQSQRIQIKNNAWFDLLKHHSANRIFIEQFHETPEKYVLLFRPLHQNDLERGNCLTGASFIYSQWEGYWERGVFDKVNDWLVRNSIPKSTIHTSGHASPGDLKRFAAALNPRKVVPIHTFFPELYNKLFQNVELHQDGERWEI
jgi:ribonuclease J